MSKDDRANRYMFKLLQELYAIIEIFIHKHRMESRLKECKDGLATTIKSIGDVMIDTDIKGRVTFMNPVYPGNNRMEARRGFG